MIKFLTLVLNQEDFKKKLIIIYSYMSHKLIISISGLHCRACELLNEQSLAELPGVTAVSVSHETGRAEIEYETPAPEKKAIEKILKENGYSLAGYDLRDSEPAINCEINHNKSGRTNWQLLIPILILVYWLVSRFNFGDASSLIQGEFSLPLAILIGVVAGFSTCLALVGGLVFGLAANYAKNHPEASHWQKFQPHLVFNFGRIFGFFLLGGLLGLVGSAFKISPFFNGLLTVFVGLVVLVLGLKLLDVAPILNKLDFALPKSWGKKIQADSPLLLGALSFFLPCGFTQAMQIYALGSGSFLNGGLIMAFFALGTAPGMLSLGGLGSLLDQKKSRLLFKIAGVVIVLFALFNINNGLKLIKISGVATIGQNTTANETATVAREGETQVVRMVESNRGYLPNRFNIIKNKPVRWVIDAQAPYSCASALIVPSLNISKQLQPGENIIEFTPDKIGEIPFSCSMGMYTGVFIVTEG